MVRKDILEMLVCPKCRGSVRERGMFLVCRVCKLAYPVIDRVPDMTAKDAWKLDRAEKSGFRHRMRL